MKFKLSALVISVILFASVPAYSADSPQVCFSPKGGCTQLIVDIIDQAKSSVLVQAYSFTSKPIAAALLKAHDRGVKVSVVADKTARRKGEQAAHLASLGVDVTVDDKHAIAHNKVMVIDGDTVITGSFNFTAAAEKSNAENVLILHDKALADKYAANWQVHRKHSDPY